MALKEPLIQPGLELVYSLLDDGDFTAADQLLSGIWDLGPRFPTVRIRPVQWAEDPFNDNYWRFLFYSLRPTSNLLWAYRQTGDQRYLDELISILDSFATFDAIRSPNRETFDDPHASAFRAMVLVNSYGKLFRAGVLPANLASKLLVSIQKLGNFLADPKNFEGSYNHGFTEASALLLLAENHPTLPNASSWRNLGLTRLMQVMNAAVDADGVEVENSPFYHFYVLNFAWEIASWAGRFGVPLDPIFTMRTQGMVEYATYALQPSGSVPLLGSSVTRSVGNLEPSVFGPIANAYPAFSYVYSMGKLGQAPSKNIAIFPVSGQVFLRSAFSPAPNFVSDTQVTFNVGPWRNAHNHLDVLAINYASAGTTILPDSGLFTYDLGPDHDYFFGTRAHNTVLVDGLNQPTSGAVGLGLTMTGPLPSNTGSPGTSWLYQSGWHTLYPGVTHRRSLLLLGRDLLLVVDNMASSQSHAYVQTWHLKTGYSTRGSGMDVDGFSKSGTKVLFRQAFTGGMRLTKFRAQESPPLAWCSDIYQSKVANVQLEYAVTGSNRRFATLIASGPYAERSVSIFGTTSGSQVDLTVCASSLNVQVRVAKQAAYGESVRVSATAPGVCP